MFSAQALADFYLENLTAEEASAPSVTDGDQVQQHLAEAHDMTGLNAVRSAYGFVGAGQTVVVIDSGIAYDHIALGGGLGADYRVVGGWDFSEENDADPYDDGSAGSHGTHVAGIIGSDHAQYPGVAPGVDLVGLRVFNDYGAGYFEWVEDALQWVHDNRNTFDNPITAVNVSLGADWNADAIPSWAMLEEEFAQLEQDGIFVGVAAGNSFLTFGEAGLGYPAASPHVVPVASVDDDGDMSFFSQRNDRVIAAPGRNITSSVPDYAGDGDGQADDFASFSGTSMATPYVTGASVLIREAFDFIGQTNVTQDQIYQLMRNTGDQVWDDDTGAFYTSLNLEAALDAIMPQDEYGSTAASAYNLGLLDADDAMSMSGVIAEMDDADYFRFVAGTTGTASISLTTDSGDADWVAGASVGTVDIDGVLSFSVVAGQEYLVAIEGDAGLARYNLDIDIEAAAIDWGTIDFATFENINTANSESWYTFRATRDGLLTVQALFDHAAGNIDIELYDANGSLLASSQTGTNNERVDLTATEGQQFLLRVTGVNPQTDIRVTNLVVQADDTVSVFGTDGDDNFGYKALDRHHVTVNGVGYYFDSQDISSIQFEGGGGADRAYLTGSAADDTAVLRAGSATLQSTIYNVSADRIETISIYSGGGEDRAYFYDSAGDDTFVAHADRGHSIMRSEGYRNLAHGFHYSDAFATAGGANDRAFFYDSAGDDIFVADADQDYSVMSGEGYQNSARGFHRSFAFATAGGAEDRAYFYDSAGDDVFVAHADRGYSLMRGDDYLNFARGFHRSYAFAAAGGMDTAMYREVGDVYTLYGRGSSLLLWSATEEYTARNFESVSAHAMDGQRPAEDVADVDYLFSKLGDWQ
ncbi:MAG: S8 family serine peptidase [Planctomycetota bacterium]|nr:S8 family serine peptidase [Planctomycetota bacterium]